MGETWVTDIRHFPGNVAGEPIPPEVHPAAFRMGEFMGRIVAAATSTFWAGARETALRCRRRPGRQRCPGHLRVLRDDEREQVHWHCSQCDDNGLISGWRGCVWDLTTSYQPPVVHDDSATVYVMDDDYALLQSALPSMDREAERAVMAAENTEQGARLMLSQAALDDLLGALSSEANKQDNRVRQRRLDKLADLLEYPRRR